MSTPGVEEDILSFLTGSLRPWIPNNPLTFIPLGVLACAVLGRQIKKWKRRQNLPPLPPGPPTSFFSGPSLNEKAPWIAYTEWKKEYGSDLIYYSYFGNKVLILNSYDAFVELFDRRGAIYSSRTSRTMVKKVLGFDFMITTMDDDEGWKLHRQLFRKYFARHGEQDTGNYKEEQVAHIHSYLRALLKDPNDYRDASRRAAAGVVLSLLYGHDVSKSDDYYLHLAEESLQSIVEAGPFGTYMVDYIPWLRFVPTWFPWTQWKRKAMQTRKKVRETLELPFKTVKDKLAAATGDLDKVSRSLVATELEGLLSERESSRHYTEEIIKNTAATSFLAGSDTTVSLTLSFFLVCTKYPEIQKRAQEEVDRVCPDRLPELSDRPYMPLIQSMIYELLRWNPATPVGVPHLVRETNTYGGYTIPAGTTVIPNMWVMLHDEKYYPDPFTFKIDRFLDPVGNLVSHSPDSGKGVNPIPDAAVFGIGRRKCPGNYIGMDFIFLKVAKLLKTFEVSKALDAHGNEIDPPAIYTPGLGSHPLPFPCVIRPRSEAAIALIQDTIPSA